ncbi:VOC family protein [Streptococcus sobrinus]|uniref:VOC family protein n=1 Tax=Streptococcus sobrinus TaxID=1310 RepID=UPI0002E790E2|nr:VOC family protein [Streptococcus sobrinus]
MIKAIELYLVTDKDGLAAIDFYERVFDAKILTKTTFGQAIPDCPEENKNLLLNAQLDIDGIRLQISDNNPEGYYIVGNNVSACLQVDDVDQARQLYDKLAVDARHIELELQETPWSPAYGIIVDKFGLTWQINTDIEGFVSETVNF